MNPIPEDGVSDGHLRRRYYKVNFMSFAQHGTIEFRQHEGTTDPRVIVAWVEFVLALVRASLALSEKAVKKLDDDEDSLKALVGAKAYQAMTKYVFTR